MNNSILKENYLEINIDIDNFTENDLYLIKNLEKLFIIKHYQKVNGHYMLNKHNNYQTNIKKNIRTIKLPKYSGLNLLTNLDYTDNRIKPNKNYNINSNITLYPNQ